VTDRGKWKGIVRQDKAHTRCSANGRKEQEEQEQEQEQEQEEEEEEEKEEEKEVKSKTYGQSVPYLLSKPTKPLACSSTSFGP
jgi:hypothetical protein